MNFEQRLSAQLATDPAFRKSTTGKRIARILALPESNKRRGRVLARMEDHAAAQIGRAGQAVNWGSVKAVDWQSVLELLIKILPLLLSLFGI
jgi:hypothetical protein